MANKKGKKYKCPYCDYRDYRDKLIDHVENSHEDMIPKGYTSTRVVYNSINKRECGNCIICHKETEWDETKQRYNTLCGSNKCKQEYVKIVRSRMIKKYGTTTLLNDPEHQKKMLEHRSISGKYKFEDGGSIGYVGSYEKKFLEFMDKFLHIKSYDIISPGPNIPYIYKGKEHIWITDFLYEPYNLVFDIKDGGSNPNTRDMQEYREKQIAKEKAIASYGDYNYIRLTDNNFEQLIEIFMTLKEMPDEKVIRINESAVLEGTKSNLDKNHVQKGKKSLSSFNKIHITEQAINKYKKEYPFLKHVRCKDTKEYTCDGYMWLDGDKLVANVGSVEYRDDNTKWIVSLEISKDYQGYGLSKQILDYAVKNMDCKYLSVNKNNEVAKRIYDNYGFRVYQESDTMYFMTLENIKTESYLYESKNKSKLQNNFEKTGINFEVYDIHSPEGIKYIKKNKKLGKKFIDYMNANENCNGEIIVDTDNDEFAAQVLVKYRDEGNVITGFYVYEEYRGYGLSNILIEDAINKYNGNILGVYKDNKVAINLYEKNGFKVIRTESDEDGKFYIMQLNPYLKESTLLEVKVKYDPPYNSKQIKDKYGIEMYDKLSKDPAHKYRMDTGIELIHKEPSRSELERIYNNWNLMSDKQKAESDRKCMELFGKTNKQYYDELINTYDESTIIEESLETFLRTNPFKQEITLFHGSSIQNKLNVIQPQSYNAGTRLSNPRMSSFWAPTFEYAELFGLFRLIEDVGFKCHFAGDCYHLYVKPSDYKLIEEELKSKVIYVYEKTLNKEFITVGHSYTIDEFTIDVPITPDKTHKINYNEFKKLFYDTVICYPDDSDETRKRMNKDEFKKMSKNSKTPKNIINMMMYHNNQDTINIVKDYKKLFIDESKYDEWLEDHLDASEEEQKEMKKKLESKSSLLESSQELFNEILEFNDKCNNMEYIIPSTGKLNVEEDDYNQYYVLSPNEFDKYNGGICWDYVLYQCDYFKKHFPSVKWNAYFYEFGTSENYHTHTFMIFKLDNKYYWFESSWKNQIGIYQFKSENEALEYIIGLLYYDQFNNNLAAGYLIKYNPLDKKWIGMNDNEFLEYMHSFNSKKYIPKRSNKKPIENFKGNFHYNESFNIFDNIKII